MLKLKLKWGRTSMPLLFSNTFWVFGVYQHLRWSKQVWRDALCISHGVTVVLKPNLCQHIPEAPPQEKQIKEALPAFSGHGLGKTIFHACCFPSCLLSLDQTDGPQPVSWLLLHVCNTESQRVKSSVVRFLTLHPFHPPSSLRLPPSAHLLPFILLSLSWLLSRFTPCRYLHVCLCSPFGLCL